MKSVASQLCQVGIKSCQPDAAHQRQRDVLSPYHFRLCVSLQAVAGMHSRKVAWLDGKPNNILCHEDPDTGCLQITVCDFDASMWIRRGPLLRVSKIAVRGTEDFSSPELLTGIQLYEECEALEELDGHTRDVVAADAWSVGAILFNAATGMTTAQSYIHAVGNRLIVHLLVLVHVGAQN
ncbi:hypothetical protein ABBQ38_011864 [Trebouxia sp. C0009 RCD-2024]